MSDDAPAARNKNSVANSSTKKSRTSTVSRATAEGEALLKEMGFDDKETTGRRRTRASIRGDAYPPPPKKERKAATPGTGRRGRPKKVEEKKTVTKEEDKKEEEEDKKKKKKSEEKKDDDEDASDEEKAE